MYIDTNLIKRSNGYKLIDESHIHHEHGKQSLAQKTITHGYTCIGNTTITVQGIVSNHKTCHQSNKKNNNNTVNIKHPASSHTTLYRTLYHLLGHLGVPFRVEGTLEDLKGA